MKRRLIILLVVCGVIGAGAALKIFATGCCDGDALCNGGVSQGIAGCQFVFEVDHDKDHGVGHDVYLYIKKQGEPGYTAFLMTLESEPPYPVCLHYTKVLSLDANSVYYYYFGCADCDEECCHDHFNTGDCGS